MPSCQDDMPWVSATPPSWPLPKRWMWHTLKDSLWGVKEKSHQCILNEGRLFQNICIYIYMWIYIFLNSLWLKWFFWTGGLEYWKKKHRKGKRMVSEKKFCVLQLLVLIQQAIHHLPIVLFLGTSVTSWMHRIQRCETPHSQLTQKRLSNKKIWI